MLRLLCRTPRLGGTLPPTGLTTIAFILRALVACFFHLRPILDERERGVALSTAIAQVSDEKEIWVVDSDSIGHTSETYDFLSVGRCRSTRTPCIYRSNQPSKVSARDRAAEERLRILDRGLSPFLLPASRPLFFIQFLFPSRFLLFFSSSLSISPDSLSIVTVPRTRVVTAQFSSSNVSCHELSTLARDTASVERADC
ncbi:unnamed protein product [Xylocopa violacea]|uniref:Uncharacterized protein n=1 Tax=Xylocopa violacea TaxID=135666 RepID=A0ABP1N434_XYLVO